METLYPIFYGTRLVTYEVLHDTFQPHMHPEAFRRGMAFIRGQEGLFGVGSGYRAPGTQPNKPGFAPPGKSFHEGQRFPSGLFYAAWDMVCVNPGGVHRTPRWSEVPAQGSHFAANCGWHMNIDTEPWHAQPIELDGWDRWVGGGRQDLRAFRPIDSTPPIVAPPVQPPVPPTQPPAKEITVDITSRNLVEGAVGNDVKFFQRLLNDIAGQGLTLDGHYGPAMTQAVRNWQMFFGATLGLTVDGQLGPKTQKSIIEIALQT